MFWLNNFSRGKTLLRRKECSGVLQNGPPFSLPLLEAQCFFLQYYYENLIGFLEVRLTKVWGPPYDWLFLKFLSPRLVHTEPLQNHQLQVRFSCVGSDFHSWGFALVNCDSWYILVCLSNLWGGNFPCLLTSLPHQNIVDFQSVQLFIYCYNSMATSKNPYMQNWRLEALL